MARFCSECGNPMVDGFSFCSQCGAKALDEPVVTASNAPVVEAPVVEEPLIQEPPFVYTPAPPAPAPVYEDPAPAPAPTYPAVSTGVYFWLMLLFSLPVVGFICTVIFSFAPKNPSLKHFSRAVLIWMLVGLILCGILAGLVLLFSNVVLSYLGDAGIFF